MSTARSVSNINTASAAVMIDQLHTKKWADVFTHQNSNYSPQYLFPPLSSSSHKGSHGRIAILGGSNKYTGAPYYAAQAALNCGVDLATIFCAAEASVPIKCYSPELMVQGVYSIERLDALLEEEEALLAELEKYNRKNDDFLDTAPCPAVLTISLTNLSNITMPDIRLWVTTQFSQTIIRVGQSRIFYHM